MPVLSLACHLPHNAPHIPSRYNNEQTTKQIKAINNSYIYIYIYISHVNVTQTVPDISPLMPMHQDPLLVGYSEWRAWRETLHTVSHGIQWVDGKPCTRKAMGYNEWKAWRETLHTVSHGIQWDEGMTGNPAHGKPWDTAASVASAAASAAVKTFPSHVKTVWAKLLIFDTNNIWVWGNVLDELSMTFTQGHGCDVD